MIKKTLFSVRNSTGHVLDNLGKMLSIAWAAGKKTTILYYAVSGITAFFPIIMSFTYKLLVDHLIESQGITPTVPLVLVAILGAREIVSITDGFLSGTLRGTYLDILFRSRLQNELNFRFYKKISNLDIAHLEDPEKQDLITKAADTFTWRPPDFLRRFSYTFEDFVGYVSSFLILIPYGIFIPFVVSIIAIPRFLLRTKYGKLQWSIYGSGAPEVKKLWYFRWLLSNKIAVKEARIFQSQNELLKRFKKIQNYLYNLNKKPLDSFLKVAVLPQFLESLVIFAFAYMRLPIVISGKMSVGDFTFFISILGQAARGAAGLVSGFGLMYEHNLYVDYYLDVLKLPRLIKEPSKPVLIKDVSIPHKIEFRDVSFSYPRSKKMVLKNVNFIINPGENFAIVGPNGAGKTTVVKLLCRFYDTTSGEILIDGVNINKIDIKSWYRCLGTLFQEFVHYNLTVKDNITLGNPGAKDKKLMIGAAQKSGATEFINKLPDKYDQMLGRHFEKGEALSQGQWQKLAIARTFYEGAPILILDEPTSAIDAESEYEIFKNLNKHYGDKTLFLISHRFSTVRNADKIVVLDKGRIIESGSHQELLENKDLYARMFKKQAEGYK